MSTQQTAAAGNVPAAPTAPAEPATAEPTPASAEPATRVPTPASAEPAPAEFGYAAAMAELEQILEALEDEDPDVDMLAARVERASELIEICRGRIRNAGIQVERVVAALEPDAAS